MYELDGPKPWENISPPPLQPPTFPSFPSDHRLAVGQKCASPVYVYWLRNTELHCTCSTLFLVAAVWQISNCKQLPFSRRLGNCTCSFAEWDGGEGKAEGKSIRGYLRRILGCYYWGRSSNLFTFLFRNKT